MKPPSLSPYFFTSFQRPCTELTQNSTLERRSSSHMPCFSLSPAKRHPSGAAKQWKQRVLNQESQEAMRTCFVFLMAEPFNFNFFNTLKPELNSICYLLALLAHHFLHVSRIRVKSLTFRRLMSYIYIYIWSTHS